MAKRDGRTLCDVCGTAIVFKKNSRGKNVPFTKATGVCHFEECTLKPRKEIADLPQQKDKPYRFFKPKIKYETIRANTTLDKFMPIDK